jgi:hypothetical protein
METKEEEASALLKAATNAAAMLSAVYQWLDRVKAAGGATSISGVASCHAMIKSLEGNRDRAEKLVMEPLRAAIAAATHP